MRQVHYGYATTRERRIVAGAMQKALNENGVMLPQEKSTLVQCLAREEHLLHQKREIKRRLPHPGDGACMRTRHVSVCDRK